MYSGGPKRPAYTVDDLRHLLTIVDSAGRSVGPLCDGVILTEYLAVSGRYYMPWVNGRPSQGADWDQYLDSLTTRNGILERLDSAAGLNGRMVWFTVMVPYPDPTQRAFVHHGQTYDLGNRLHRREVIGDYVRQLVHRVKKLQLKRLSFYGFYWLNESLQADDSSVTDEIGDYAHGLNYYRLQWIPSWRAAGAGQWRDFGFDDDNVWQQPNYFFHPDVARSRLDSAFAFARSARMGIELEFDRRLFTDPRLEDRLTPYLEAFENAPDMRNRPIAIYEGGGALIQLARSTDPKHRALYRRLVGVLRPEVRL